MGERLLTELFCTFRPNADGALEDRDVARLNRLLAQHYVAESTETGAELPPPEPLPRGTLRFATFRTHVHRALATFAPGAAAREQALERLIEEAKKPEPVAEPPAGVEEEKRVDDLLVDLEAPVVEDCVAGVPACWAPPVLLGNLNNERFHAMAKMLDEGRAGQAAKDVLSSSRRYGALALESSKQALESSKQVLERARGSVSALVASSSFKERQAAAMALLSKVLPEERCAPRTREEEAAVVLLDDCSTVCADQLDEERINAVDFPAEESFVCEVPYGEEPAAGPEHFSFQARGPPQTSWRFAPRDGLHIDVRSHPDIDAPRTGMRVWPGECVAVSHEHRGVDGVLYLQLADGRGWIFDHKPGLGPLCVRV